MADDSDEEFFFYGTPLQDQEETGGVRKLGGAPQDAVSSHGGASVPRPCPRSS
jgi:hypothetical protein